MSFFLTQLPENFSEVPRVAGAGDICRLLPRPPPSPREPVPGLRRVPGAPGRRGSGRQRRDERGVRLRESRTLGGREGRREEGLCRTLTCLSVAVTLRGHRCESRAQLHGSPSDSRSHSPTHPSPPQHVLPPDTQFTLPGGPSTGTHCRDAHSTATVTHLVTPALARSHAEPTLLTQRVPPRLHCPPATSTQMSPSSRAELATSPSHP